MATKKEDPAVTEALDAVDGSETQQEQYDAIVQAGEDLAADGDTEASTGTEDAVVLSEALTEEASLFADPRAAEREEWIAANPDANVIPHDLLPPAFQDGTIITPGLP